MTCPNAVITDRAVFFDGQELPWKVAHANGWRELKVKVADEYTDELFALLKALHGRQR